MDLAQAPTLPGLLPRSASPETGETALRVLASAEAASADFQCKWSELTTEASEPNPFFEPWFLRPSLEAFGAEDRCTLLAHFTGKRLTGILPIARPKRYYGYPIPHISGWLHANAFCGAPLVTHGHERAFWRDLLAHCDSAAGTALFLHCPSLPADGPMNRALDAVLQEADRLAVTVEEAERAMLSSDLSPEAYFEASMSTKKRKELRRQKKRLGEEGEFAFERSEGADGIDQWIADFLVLEAAGWKGDAGSALANADATNGFFNEALIGAANVGKLERLTMRLNGRPIAMLANFITAPGAFSFKTAFHEDYARFSPGLLLQIENLDLLKRSDIEWTDSCAVEGHSMIERIWREKRRMVSRNIAIGGPLRRTAFRALTAYETRNRSDA